jgi:hypothetical protein
MSYREIVALRDLHEDRPSALIGQANAAFYGGVSETTDGLATDTFLDGMEDLFEDYAPSSQNTETFGGMAVIHSGMGSIFLEDDDKENIPELEEPPTDEDEPFIEPEDRSSHYDVNENHGGDSVPSAIYDPEEQLDDEEEEVEEEPVARPGLFDSDSDDDDEPIAPIITSVAAVAAPTLKGLLKPSTYVTPGFENIDYTRLTIDDEVELEGEDGLPVVFTPMGFPDPTSRFEQMNEYGMLDTSASKRHFEVESPKEYELKLKYRKMSLEASMPPANTATDDEVNIYEGKSDEAPSGKASGGNY